MKTMQRSAFHQRMIGRSAFTGVLVALLATQSFAQGGAMRISEATAQDTNATEAATQAATPAMAETPAPKLVAALDLNALPNAPSPEQPVAAAPNDASSPSALTSTSAAPKSHKARPALIALGVAGAAAAALGACIFSIKTKDTGERDALGTVFLAPGAAAAGLGFYFAFRK